MSPAREHDGNDILNNPKILISDIRGDGAYPVHNLDLFASGSNKIVKRGEVDGTTTVAVNPHESFLLGKRRHSPEQRREYISNKIQQGEELTIEEKRSNEAEAVKKTLKQH